MSTKILNLNIIPPIKPVADHEPLYRDIQPEEMSRVAAYVAGIASKAVETTEPVASPAEPPVPAVQTPELVPPSVLSGLVSSQRDDEERRARYAKDEAQMRAVLKFSHGQDLKEDVRHLYPKAAQKPVGPSPETFAKLEGLDRDQHFLRWASLKNEGLGHLVPAYAEAPLAEWQANRARIR